MYQRKRKKNRTLQNTSQLKLCAELENFVEKILIADLYFPLLKNQSLKGSQQIFELQCFKKQDKCKTSRSNCCSVYIPEIAFLHLLLFDYVFR